MFQKLFNKVDEFIDKFKEINSFDELSKITIDILQIIKETLCENLSEDMEDNEKIFDEIMHEPGLWKSLGEKAKKAMKENPGCDMWKISGGKLSNVNGQTAFKGKDNVAKQVVKEYLGYLANGIVNIVNILS